MFGSQSLHEMAENVDMAGLGHSMAFVFVSRRTIFKSLNGKKFLQMI